MRVAVRTGALVAFSTGFTTVLLCLGPRATVGWGVAALSASGLLAMNRARST